MSIYEQPTYQIWLSDEKGRRLELLDYVVKASFSKAIHTIGRFSITLPESKIKLSQLKPDFTIQIWRNIPNQSRRLEFLGFIRKVRLYSRDGKYLIDVSGEDSLSLLDSRIVAYPAGSSEASKTDYVDDIMKAVVRENLGSLALSDRALELLAVSSDLSLGTNISARFAWANVLESLKKLFNISVQEGLPVFFNIVPIVTIEGIAYIFETYLNQIGQDRSYDSNNPTLFSEEFGNLENPSLEYDYSDEKTYIYVGGQGEGSDREIVEVSSTALGRSIWNRKEQFGSYTNAESTTELEKFANAKLQSRIPTTRFTGNLSDTPQARYGIDWEYGDKVQIIFRDAMFGAWINGIHFSLDETGKERIQARIEVYL